MTDQEPTLTRAVLGGLIAGAVLIAVSRINRTIDLFNGDELEAFKTWLPLATSLVAGVLIRRQVTPNAKVEERASTVEAMVYAQALQDAPPAAPAPPPGPARVRPVRKAPVKKR